jgi:hypothetical protein
MCKISQRRRQKNRDMELTCGRSWSARLWVRMCWHWLREPQQREKLFREQSVESVGVSRPDQDGEYDKVLVQGASLQRCVLEHSVTLWHKVTPQKRKTGTCLVPNGTCRANIFNFTQQDRLFFKSLSRVNTIRILTAIHAACAREQIRWPKQKGEGEARWIPSEPYSRSHINLVLLDTAISSHLWNVVILSTKWYFTITRLEYISCPQ